MVSYPEINSLNLGKNEILDEIDYLLDEIYEKLYNEDKIFLRITKELQDFVKGNVEILLGGEYKNTSQKNTLELHINSEKIILEKIINSFGNSDNIIFLLLQKSIKENIPIEGKADALLHGGNNYERRQKILREFYLKFLFKSKSKVEYDRNNLKFDFDNLSLDELKVFYNRLKKFGETGKWSINI